MGTDSTVHNDEEPDVLDEYRKQQRWRNMSQLSFLEPRDNFEMRGITGPCDEPEIYLVHKPGPDEELVGYFCGATAFIGPGLRRRGFGREMILMAYTQAGWKDKRQLFTRSGKAATADAHRYIVERASELGIRKSGLPPCICGAEREIAKIVAEIEADVSATDQQFDRLSAINKSKEDVELFRVMIGQDVKYLFRMIAVVWPNLLGLFAAGTVTKSKPYIDKVLGKYAPRFGFEVRLVRSFPAVPNAALGTSPAEDEDARPKLYQVSHDREHKPLFFCPVGPSAKRPGQRAQFRRQFSDNATPLQKVLGL